MKKFELTKWLKYIIIITSFIGFFFIFLIAPWIGKDFTTFEPSLAYLFWPCLIFIWVTAIPFYIALGISWFICNDVLRDSSFSKQNAKRLKVISKLALLESILYVVASIALFVFNLLHPSILLIILFIIFIGIAIAVVTAVLSHLVEKASDIKDENDLTI